MVTESLGGGVAWSWEGRPPGEHLLRRHVEGAGAQVHAPVLVDAGHHEEEAGALGAAAPQPEPGAPAHVHTAHLPSRKMTARSYSCTTFTQPQMEKGSVRRTST